VANTTLISQGNTTAKVVDTGSDGSFQVLTEGTERLRITSTGNVGIGTDNPTNAYGIDKSLHIHSSLSSGTRGSGIHLTTNASGNTSSDGVSIRLVDTDLSIDNRETGIINFLTQGSERARVTSGGNIEIANGNLVFSTSGTGIDFSANGNAAGMTSELLDDYEEGTWTPANAVTTLTNNSTALYTKIGRFVCISFDITLATNASSSAIEITGLPFSGTNSVFFFGTMMSDNLNILNAFPFISTSTMQFQISSTTAGGRDTVAYSRILSSGVIRGSVCYLV